jgi:hypothetical protein
MFGLAAGNSVGVEHLGAANFQPFNASLFFNNSLINGARLLSTFLPSALFFLAFESNSERKSASLIPPMT